MTPSPPVKHIDCLGKYYEAVFVDIRHSDLYAT